MSDDDNRLDDAQIALLWTVLRVAKKHITDASVLADIDRAIEPLEERYDSAETNQGG